MSHLIEAEQNEKSRNVGDLDMTTDKHTQTRQKMELAEAYFKDAQYQGLSVRSRADAAFDACYMYALVLLGPSSAGRRHPDPEVLVLAAETLGWSRADIEPAVERLKERDEPLRDGSRYEKLIALARRLREVV
ncbi:MAG: hypothetical protein P4L96_10240 [Rhodoferax sp.]|nr:hypothetical protein [Rhodoferax sp.]